MRTPFTRSTAAVLASFTLVLAACGADDEEASTTTDPGADTEQDDDATAATQPADDAASVELPTVVVTTNILGDVVENALGDAAEVVTIMPVGADPHDFQASAQEVDVMMSADALIVNGAALEESLVDVIEAAEGDGVPTFEAISAVDTIEFGEGGHDHDHGDEGDHDHSDEGKDEDHDHDHGDEDHDHDHGAEGDHDHSDEGDHDHGDEGHTHSDEEKDEGHDHGDGDHEHGDEGDHDHHHDGEDPHFWTDPMRMADAVEGIVGFLQETVDFADPAAVEASADAYIAELTALNDEIEAMVATVAEENRKLVTNHLAYGYFADAFGFEQVGTVIPGGSTTDTTSGGELAELIEVVQAEGVPAVFSDNTASDELIQVLAEEAGGVTIVELLSGSLSEPGSEGDTYLDMQRVNAERITSALA